MNKLIHNRWALLMLAFVLSAFTAQAQKPLKVLKAAVKAGKSADVLREVQKLQQDSAWRQSPQVFDYAFQGHRLAYEAQNEKMYLHQKADTVAFFTAVHGMFRSAKTQLGYEIQADASGKREQHGSSHSDFLRKQVANYVTAYRFFYSHGEYALAMEAADSYLCLSADSVFWGVLGIPECDPEELQMAALIHQQSSHTLKRHQEEFIHADLALTYEPRRADILENLALARVALGDDAAYKDSLLSLVRQYPERKSSFELLKQYYIEREDYESILALTHIMLQIDSSRLDILNAQADALYMLDYIEDLSAVSQKILSYTPDAPAPNYYLGLYYVHQAKAVPVPIQRGSNPENYRKLLGERRQLYSLAREPMEKYRSLCPDKSSLWAQPLYDIYLNLNMGSEFEEISKLLQ